MDLKSDDIFNIDIEPALLLSYELDKLSISKDVFEFSEENPKNCDIVKKENIVVSETENKSCSSIKTNSSPKQRSDGNGNESHSSCENLNRLFDELELSDLDDNKEELFDCVNYKVELSDSDNEANEECSKFKERAPVKTQSRARKNRDKSNILNKNKSSDKSEFNAQTLKFLSGSSQVEFHEPNTADQIAIFPSLTSVIGNDSSTSFIQDYFYEDARSKIVCSPESGYESSSAQSGSSSPPLPSSTSYNLDLIPESVLEFLVENVTDCALTDHKLSPCNSDDKESKIIEIMNQLKDTPNELNESSNVVTFSNTTQEYVPLIKINTHELNVKSVPVPCVYKNAEVPKKLVYKLNDKAKNKLRKFLSGDEFYAAQARIYSRLREAEKNCKDEKVIYVEDRSDKASENRTNLHHAVLESRIEDIYCLVEIQKQYNKPLADINLRDKYGKTALDYAIQNQLTLVVDYLKENCACQSVII